MISYVRCLLLVFIFQQPTNLIEGNLPKLIAVGFSEKVARSCIDRVARNSKFKVEVVRRRPIRDAKSRPCRVLALIAVNCCQLSGGRAVAAAVICGSRERHRYAGLSCTQCDCTGGHNYNDDRF